MYLITDFGYSKSEESDNVTVTIRMFRAYSHRRNCHLTVHYFAFRRFEYTGIQKSVGRNSEVQSENCN